jgi:hypothetical protein
MGWAEGPDRDQGHNPLDGVRRRAAPYFPEIVSRATLCAAREIK